MWILWLRTEPPTNLSEQKETLKLYPSLSLPHIHTQTQKQRDEGNIFKIWSSSNVVKCNTIFPNRSVHFLCVVALNYSTFSLFYPSGPFELASKMINSPLILFFLCLHYFLSLLSFIFFSLSPFIHFIFLTKMRSKWCNWMEEVLAKWKSSDFVLLWQSFKRTRWRIWCKWEPKKNNNWRSRYWDRSHGNISQLNADI